MERSPSPNRDLPPEKAYIPQNPPQTGKPAPGGNPSPNGNLPGNRTPPTGGNTQQTGPGNPNAVGPEPIVRTPESIAPMTGTGWLIFQVTTARGAIPLEGAQVTVRDHDPDMTPESGNESGTGTSPAPDSPRGRIRAIMISGPDGKTPPLALPTPDKSLSLSVKGKNAPLPFARYDAEVLLSGFYPQEYTLIPLFDGITSLQRVDMIPLPAGGAVGNIPDDTFITEGQNPDL